MSDRVWSLDEVGRNEWAVTDALTDCQIGWITGTKIDQFFVRNMDFVKLAGPFKTLLKARDNVEETLSNEFGVGSPGN
jgi:hypothetical protein